MNREDLRETSEKRGVDKKTLKQDSQSITSLTNHFPVPNTSISTTKPFFLLKTPFLPYFYERAHSTPW